MTHKLELFRVITFTCYKIHLLHEFKIVKVILQNFKDFLFFKIHLYFLKRLTFDITKDNLSLQQFV